MAGRINIIKYMAGIVVDYVDPQTGEVNATGLAEEACDHFNDYERGLDNFEIPDKYFEYAEEVATRHEIKTGVKDGNISGLSGLINHLDSSWF